jgi:hypothetical protein
MKKTALQITSLLLAIILLTSAIACSKSPASTDLPTDAPTDATESPTEKDTDPDEKPTEKPTEPKEPSLAPSVELGARAAVISASKPAIPATEGEEVDLSKYYVQFRTTDDPFTPDQVKWSSEQIEIQNGKFTPSEKGVYTLTATADGRSINVYLVVKAAYEDEYVLYYNDFESADALGQLTKASSSGGASYAIEDGKLVVRCSDAVWVGVSTDTRRARCKFSQNGEILNEVEIPLDFDYEFFRITVKDAQGRFAYSNAFFKDAL